MRIIDADELLKGRTDHEMISTHLIFNAPTVDVLEQIENDISHEISDIDESDFRRGVNIGLCHAIQHVRKYR